MNYHVDEYHVYCIQYHLAWTTKRRRRVLHDAIAADCRQLIQQTCAEHGWEIQALAIRPDHVNLLVRVWPSVSAADVVKALRRRTAHELYARYPALRQLSSVWTRAYFAATVGTVGHDAVQRFIALQKRR